MTKTQKIEAYLHSQGFDLSTGTRVRCSRCEAAAISGHACHETGCPNTVHECKGCTAPVSRRGAYCEDCQ